MAEVRGYSTSCRGKIRVVSTDGSKSSRYYVSPGPVRLTMETESEPGHQYEFSGDPAYMCSDQARHELSFTAQPGRSYRLWLDQPKPREFKIEVREAPNPKIVEAQLIPSKSNQTSIRTICGFYGLLLDCNL